MERLVEELRTGLSSAFESEEYATRRRALEEEFQERQQESLDELQERAHASAAWPCCSTPAGLAFAPMKDGEVLPPEEFQKLPEEERKRIQGEMEALQEELQKVLLQRAALEARVRQPPARAERRGHRRGRRRPARRPAGEVRGAARRVSPTSRRCSSSVGEHLADFLEAGEEKPAEGAGRRPARARTPSSELAGPAPLQVNVLVDSGGATGAPVIYESNPTYLNLVGRVEQIAKMGALVTDFTLIKPGALHRANGGYLMLDALQGADAALRLGGAEARPAVPRRSASSRRCEMLSLHQHRLAGAGADPAGRQGDPARRPPALLPARRARPGLQRAVQGRGRLRRRVRCATPRTTAPTRG